MPIYDFTCRACGKRFDKLFRSTPDRPKADYPACGSPDTSRGLSLVNVGAERPGGSGGAGSDLPTCGRCGVPGGPCVTN